MKKTLWLSLVSMTCLLAVSACDKKKVEEAEKAVESTLDGVSDDVASMASEPAGDASPEEEVVPPVVEEEAPLTGEAVDTATTPETAAVPTEATPETPSQPS